MRHVLIIQYSSSRDGSTFSGLLLADGLRAAGWTTHVAFGHAGPMEAEYAAHGHTTHIVPHKNWLRRADPLRFMRDGLAEMRSARLFQELMKRLRPDLVYLNTVVSVAGALAARRQGLPCIWHLRELFADVGGEMQAPIWARPFVRTILRRYATQLIANSRAVAENMLGSWADRAAVVPNAVDNTFFTCATSSAEARQRFSLPQDGLVLGVPGMLRPVKGHPFLFRAIRPLLAEWPNLVIAVTGDGQPDFVASLHRQVKELGIEAHVRFLGIVTDMPVFYRTCDAVCIPSRSETFGRTVIEAMATGTPVVASAVGGIREILDDGVTGLLVSYGDDAALTKILHHLLSEAELCFQLARAARQKAENEYHEQVYNQSIAKIVYATLNQ